MADWEWFFASEYGRDKMLRSEIEYLSSASASASAHNARLSSQLAQLQGSLESRLTALSAAFDAYVELGDVREQLAAYGDAAAIRRDAGEAVEALAAGRSADPVDVGDGRYWLPFAVNAVIALLAGAADPAAEEQARTLSRDADLFVVVAVGALERGELVADRVPALLVSDEALRLPQVVLWEALLAGVYPSEHDLLGAVGESWQPVLAGGDGPEWHAWVRDRSRAADAVGELQWVRDLLAGEVAVPTADVLVDRGTSSTPAAFAATETDPRAQLRSVAGTMLAEGSDQERELLVRSRELRRRIEDPGSAPTNARPADEPQQPVRALVRLALDTPDPELRERLIHWLRPGLLTVVGEIARAPRPDPQPVEVRTPGGGVVVSPTGPEPSRLTQVTANIAESHATSGQALIVPAVAAGVLAVGAIVTALAGGQTSVVVLLLIAAVVLAGVSVRAVWLRNAARKEVELDTASLHRSVELGVERARTTQRAHDEQSAATDQLVRELRSALDPVSA